MICNVFLCISLITCLFALWIGEDALHYTVKPPLSGDLSLEDAYVHITCKTWKCIESAMYVTATPINTPISRDYQKVF